MTRIVPSSKFASLIAHEINQPLGAIITNGEAALRWLERDIPDLAETRAAIQRIIRDARRACEVVDRTRAGLCRNESAYQDLDLNQLVTDVIDFTGGEQRRSNVSVQTRLSSELPAIRGDRVQLQQVLLNLVLNGVEAMAEVIDRPRILRIETAVLGTGEVMVAVEDEGVGLDPTTMGQMFDCFFTTKAGGLGLGLPISRSIVEAHGGTLWAAPTAAPGAVFRFVLPVRAERTEFGRASGKAARSREAGVLDKAAA